MNLVVRSWSGCIMGTRAKLVVVTSDARAGDEALRRAVDDLEETEAVLSRFREDSELGRLNRVGTLVANERLLVAFREAAGAYEWSDGLLDPRVLDTLEAFGYTTSVPKEDVGDVAPARPLCPVRMRGWLDEKTGRITLPEGTRIDLAGVGKALGIGWAAVHLAGHAGLLVDVGGDVLALGTDESGEPWRVAVEHGEVVGELTGFSLAVATSTTTRRRWKAAGREAHHLIDPRTGAPSEGELLYATVSAPTIIEADLAAKLLILKGPKAMRKFRHSSQTVVTDRHGQTRFLGDLLEQEESA